jgi:hypothetical protein
MFKTSGARFKTLRRGDDDFMFSPDGLTMVPRASFVISSGCPTNYREIIAECVNHGWLKPVAYMRDEEYTWEILQK